MMKPRPSSGTVPYFPRSIWNAMAKVHEPLLGSAASLPGRQGHTKSQLQVS